MTIYLNIGEDRRLDVIPFCSHGLSTGEQGGSFVLAMLDVGKYLLELFLIDLRII